MPLREAYAPPAKRLPPLCRPRAPPHPTAARRRRADGLFRGRSPGQQQLGNPSGTPDAHLPRLRRAHRPPHLPTRAGVIRIQPTAGRWGATNPALCGDDACHRQRDARDVPPDRTLRGVEPLHLWRRGHTDRAGGQPHRADHPSRAERRRADHAGRSLRSPAALAFPELADPDYRVLRRRLYHFRSQGFSVNAGLYEREVSGVAVALHNDLGDTLGGLSVSTPSARFRTVRERCVKVLTRRAAELNKSLERAHITPSNPSIPALIPPPFSGRATRRDSGCTGLPAQRELIASPFCISMVRVTAATAAPSGTPPA